MCVCVQALLCAVQGAYHKCAVVRETCLWRVLALLGAEQRTDLRSAPLPTQALLGAELRTDLSSDSLPQAGRALADVLCVSPLHLYTDYTPIQLQVRQRL